MNPAPGLPVRLQDPGQRWSLSDPADSGVTNVGGGLGLPMLLAPDPDSGARFSGNRSWFDDPPWVLIPVGSLFDLAVGHCGVALPTSGLHL